mmetsp:Transcript_75428/g.245358  ORF Transcript_75428/g.245358 Transcript_75428/m.245358 type:complete len:196 (+) Transcript_75428:452-1039(+)
MSISALLKESEELPDRRRAREQGDSTDLVDVGNCGDFGDNGNLVGTGASMLRTSNPAPPSLNISECSGLMKHVRLGTCMLFFATTFDSGPLLCMGHCAAFTPAGEFSPTSHERGARDLRDSGEADDFGESGNLGDSATSMLRTGFSNGTGHWDLVSDLSKGPALLTEVHILRSLLAAMPIFNSGRPMPRTSFAEL